MVKEDSEGDVGGSDNNSASLFPPATRRRSCRLHHCDHMITTMGQVGSGWGVIAATSGRKATRIKHQWTNPTVLFYKTLNTVTTPSFEAGQS